MYSNWFKKGALCRPADDFARDVCAKRAGYFLAEARDILDHDDVDAFCDVIIKARRWSSTEEERDRAILLVDMARMRYGAKMAKFLNLHNF